MSSFPYISTRHNEEIVSLELAKKWLRMDIPGFSGEDDVILAAIDSAIARVERECNLSLGVSEYTWNTTGLPCDFRDVKYVLSVESVEIDGEIIPASDYALIRTGPALSRIDWKNVRSGEKMTLVFKAGFGAANVPKDLVRAVRALVGAEFDDRGDGVNERKTLSEKLMDNWKYGYAG